MHLDTIPEQMRNLSDRMGEVGSAITDIQHTQTQLATSLEYTQKQYEETKTTVSELTKINV